MTDWEKEGVTARAVELYRQGFSATQISKALAQQFKVHVSRNAVIGKMRRLGETKPQKASAPRKIAATPKPPKPPKPPPQPRTLPSRPVRPVTMAHGQSPPPARRVEPYVPQVHSGASDSKILTLVELGSCQCRWPVGAKTGAEQRFCGAAYADDDRRQPYCDEHLEASVSVAWKQAKKAGKHTEGELARSIRKFI